MNKFWIALISVITIIVYMFFAMYGLLVLAFNGTSAIYILLYLIFIFITLCIGMYVLPKVLRKEKINKKYGKMYVVACLLIFMTGIIPYAYDKWQNRFATVTTEVDLSLYEPFNSEQLAMLDHPTTYHMDTPLLRLDGATALYPIYASFVQAVYPEKEYSLYTSEVQCNKTDMAYEGLIKDETDVIFAAGPSKEQLALAKQSNLEFHMVPIGKEAFVFFVNASNPIDSLTVEQIRDIYSGAITNWKDVGGNDEEVEAFQRPENSGSQTALQKIMKDTPIIQPIEDEVKTGMGGIIKEAADYQNHRQAIGYSFRYYATEMVQNNEIKLLKIAGIYPDEQSIKNETYPFTNDFYAIYTKEDKRITTFIDWMLSSDGQELIQKSGYIPYYFQ